MLFRSPVIMLDHGKPWLAVGGAGGPRIISGVFEVIVNLVDYKLNLQEAVNAPRFHNQWLPDVVNVEKSFFPDTLNVLRKMGYSVQIGLEKNGGSPYWSDAECIAVDEKTGLRLGATDGRNSNGKAVGY